MPTLQAGKISITPGMNQTMRAAELSQMATAGIQMCRGCARAIATDPDAMPAIVSAAIMDCPAGSIEKGPQLRIAPESSGTDAASRSVITPITTGAA